MDHLDAAAVRQAVALMAAGRRQEAHDLIAAQPGMTADDLEKIWRVLAYGAEVRQRLVVRNRAALVGSMFAVAGGLAVVLLAALVKRDTGLHGPGAGVVALVVFFAVVLGAFAAGWKLVTG